jgi:beta-lactamase superfamily II metal-dependent hydrolase
VSADSNYITPPEPNELEISLFGPGFGECSVVHTGDGNWIIIDSCLTDERRPAALQYLESMGIDPAIAVTEIVITHPDNDHIGGIASVYKACTNARLVVSTAFTERDMVAWTMLYSQPDPSEMTRASSELARVFEIAMARGTRPIFALQDRVITKTANLSLSVLAPSDAKIQAFLRTVVLPKKSDEKRKPPGLSPNPASVVVLLETPHFGAIFGGDLEETPGRGWTDIMTNSIVFKSSRVPTVYKVPHHGSPNADLPALWAHFGKSIIAIMTNFNSGKTPRPSPEDVERVLGYTDAAYVCSSRRGSAPKKQHDVEKHLKLIGIKRKRRFSRDGHIRIRMVPSTAPRVELFGAAAELAKLHDAA